LKKQKKKTSPPEPAVPVRSRPCYLRNCIPSITGATRISLVLGSPKGGIPNARGGEAGARGHCGLSYLGEGADAACARRSERTAYSRCAGDGAGVGRRGVAGGARRRRGAAEGAVFRPQWPSVVFRPYPCVLLQQLCIGLHRCAPSAALHRPCCRCRGPRSCVSRPSYFPTLACMWPTRSYSRAADYTYLARLG
jgi:hypothetical protein